MGLFAGAVLVASLNGGVGQQPVSGSLSDRELGQIWGREDPPEEGCLQYVPNGNWTWECVPPTPLYLLGYLSECTFKGCGSGENGCGTGKRWADLFMEKQVLTNRVDPEIGWVAESADCWWNKPCTNVTNQYFAGKNCHPNTYNEYNAELGQGCYEPVGVAATGCQHCADDEIDVLKYKPWIYYTPDICPPLP